MEYIYYCSSNEGLKYITKSNESQIHGITGCKSEIASILNFISRNNDFKFSIGKDLHSDLYYICERFEGSIRSSLKREKASVYLLKHPFYDDSQAFWQDKLLISVPCEVINEKIILDLYDYLVEMSKLGSLTICWYPEKINGIPENDQDLVDLATLQYRMYGDIVLSQIENRHPQLLNRVKQGINSELFKEYGI